MREIIFRGKRLDNREWYYGSYLFLHISSVDWTGAKMGKPEDVHYIVNDQDINYAVIPSTVGQYTGLKDKHGKRIFEGDILGSRYDELYPDDVAIEVVKWFRNGWYIQQENNLPDALCEYGVLPYSEVIGNIHDNPELLKEEAQP